MQIIGNILQHQRMYNWCSVSSLIDCAHLAGQRICIGAGMEVNTDIYRQVPSGMFLVAELKACQRLNINMWDVLSGRNGSPALFMPLSAFLGRSSGTL